MLLLLLIKHRVTDWQQIYDKIGNNKRNKVDILGIF